jgi:hypothetical protein
MFGRVVPEGIMQRADLRLIVILSGGILKDP